MIYTTLITKTATQMCKKSLLLKSINCVNKYYILYLNTQVMYVNLIVNTKRINEIPITSVFFGENVNKLNIVKMLIIIVKIIFYLYTATLDYNKYLVNFVCNYVCRFIIILSFNTSNTIEIVYMIYRNWVQDLTYFIGDVI